MQLLPNHPYNTASPYSHCGAVIKLIIKGSGFLHLDLNSEVNEVAASLSLKYFGTCVK